MQPHPSKMTRQQIENRIAMLQEKLERQEERIGRLMSQRVSTEEDIVDLLDRLLRA